jgi:hypothetical protein
MPAACPIVADHTPFAIDGRPASARVKKKSVTQSEADDPGPTEAEVTHLFSN